MRNRFFIAALVALLCRFLPVAAHDGVFNVKGVIPWHNFLCGPSAWDEDDYRKYLDECQKKGINFVGFHNYTGGAERYASYVEPMIRIGCRGIVPEAFFDNSLTSRWGAVPVTKYYYDSEKYLDLKDGVFGHQEHGEMAYAMAHELMGKVLEMAHERNMKMAMGFEFGIIPPEYFSQYSPEGRFFWLGQAGMIPNPCNPTSVDIHFSAVDDILDSYSDIDYIWLWLSEHSFMDVDLNMALSDQRFRERYEEASKYFPLATEQTRFLGAWSLEYIRLTQRRISERGSKARIILGGWGGGNQLPAILEGLDKALGEDVIFSCLNPDLGKAAQPDYLADIAKHRQVWTIPWLEGDHQLWHWQPRLSLMKDQVKKAAAQNLDGVCCIHWRTWENKYNFEAFNDFADDSSSDESLESMYTRYFSDDFGPYAASLLAPVFAEVDRSQCWRDISSPEYFAYNPWWGRLDDSNKASRAQIVAASDKALARMKPGARKDNLLKFRSVFWFELLLDKVGRCMESGWNIRNSYLRDGIVPSPDECSAALSLMYDDILRSLVEAYCARSDNKGDMGILVSINQRLCQSWTGLRRFLESKCNKGVEFNRQFAPSEGWLKGNEKLYRNELCINGTWEFSPVAEVDAAAALCMAFDDSVIWERTAYKVPSPWNVNSFARGGGDFCSYPSYPVSWENAKAGWVRKTVKIPSAWVGRIVLSFDALAGFSKVFVNGIEVSVNRDSFLPFKVDVTDLVTPGSQAEIRLFIAHNSIFDEPGKFGSRPYVSGSFWGNHIVGIWQDVRLLNYPDIYIEDVFVRPEVSEGRLRAEVAIMNTTGKQVKARISGSVRDWVNDAGTETVLAPEPSWHEGSEVLSFPVPVDTKLAPGLNKVELSVNPEGKLDLWEMDSPVLYGMTVNLSTSGRVRDAEWTRFGWREFSILDKKFYLNGRHVVMKGDSWHFMGVPQMTRRYPWAWYTMLKDANANAVRLHAQVYPEFYLEMADEMGICVLDESSIWASDACPKLDSPEYWNAAASHVAGMVRRDRNHPSVLGWSVTNEVMGVMDGVFHSRNRLEEMAGEINKLVAVAEANDGTRDWISADGEVQWELNTSAFLGHYYIPSMIMEWKDVDKPWGIGEMGMCYAGTPVEVSSVNGDRAYQSIMGRMEGLAGEAFESISQQRNLGASYTSIFNLAWYALKPLELGLSDTCRAVTSADGIWFSEFREGVPGMQPERLGPYTTTFNPGYDPSLPLYRTWPLFDGIKAAFSDDFASIKNVWAVKQNTVVDCPAMPARRVAWVSSDPFSVQTEVLEKAGMEFVPVSPKERQVIIIDGQNGAEVDAWLRTAVESGATAFLWNACGSVSSDIIRELTGDDVTFEPREASSFVIAGKHPVLNGQSESTLYFSEKVKNFVSHYVFSPSGADVLLNPCVAEWKEWNWQPETIKTAKVLKSERETKPQGCVMAVYKVGKGELIVSTLDFSSMGKYANSLLRDMFHNLGVSFLSMPEVVPKSIDAQGVLKSALVAGGFSAGDWDETMKTDFTSTTDFRTLLPGNDLSGRYWDIVTVGEDASWDFLSMDLKGEPKDCVVYMSLWVYSPRSLTNLLIEPNIPRVDLEYSVDDELELRINGVLFDGGSDSVRGKVLRGLPLEKGWNHILLKVCQKWGGWNGTFRFVSTDKDFVGKLDSAVILNEK